MLVVALLVGANAVLSSISAGGAVVAMMAPHGAAWSGSPDMALRSVPIRRSGVRNNLFMGGDRELVMLAAVAAAGLIGPAINEPKAWVAGLVIWVGGLWAARLMAKSDPLLRGVYLRHRSYKAYYAAHSTPFRENKASQRRRYRQPGKKK